MHTRPACCKGTNKRVCAKRDRSGCDQTATTASPGYSGTWCWRTARLGKQSAEPTSRTATSPATKRFVTSALLNAPTRRQSQWLPCSSALLQGDSLLSQIVSNTTRTYSHVPHTTNVILHTPRRVCSTGLQTTDAGQLARASHGAVRSDNYIAVRNFKRHPVICIQSIIDHHSYTCLFFVPWAGTGEASRARLQDLPLEPGWLRPAGQCLVPSRTPKLSNGKIYPRVQHQDRQPNIAFWLHGAVQEDIRLLQSLPRACTNRRQVPMSEKLHPLRCCIHGR